MVCSCSSGLVVDVVVIVALVVVVEMVCKHNDELNFETHPSVRRSVRSFVCRACYVSKIVGIKCGATGKINQTKLNSNRIGLAQLNSKLNQNELNQIETDGSVQNWLIELTSAANKSTTMGTSVRFICRFDKRASQRASLRN